MGESPTLAFAKSCLALFASGKENPSASGCTIYGASLPNVVSGPQVLRYYRVLSAQTSSVAASAAPKEVIFLEIGVV